MQRASDAVIGAVDLVNAGEEIKRGDGPKIMARLHQTEPYLAMFLEGFAALAARPPKDAVIGADRAMDSILIIVRAIELGNERLWRDILPSPSK